MYTFYPTSNLQHWFNQNGHLLKNNDLWHTPYLILLYGKSLANWLEKNLVDNYGIHLGGIHSEHVDSSLLYWTQQLLNKRNSLKPVIIIEEKLLFLRLYQANKRLKLLPPEEERTISYLRRIAQIFWEYQCEEASFLSNWDIQQNYCKEERLQVLLWKEIFGTTQRTYLTLNEALNRLAKLSFSVDDLPFSTLFYFNAYHNKPYLLRFLTILSQKGFNIHHICFSLPEQMVIQSLPTIAKTCYIKAKELTNFPKDCQLVLDHLPFKPPRHLLQAIQHVLRGNDLKSFKIEENDHSFNLIQVNSALREVEVISDKILFILQDPLIKAEDISLVLTKESPYTSIIETIFPQKGIPYRFIKKKPFFEDASLEQAFKTLLSFTQSDFSLEDILPFLSNAHVLKKLGRSPEDYQNFELFTQKANVLYGMDSWHKKKLTSCQEDSHTWTKAFERLYIGLLSLDNELIEERPPIDYTFLQWSKISPFIEIIKNLWNDSQILSHCQLTIKEWFHFFFSFLERYLDSQEPAFLFLRQKLNALLKLNNSFVKGKEEFLEEVYSFNYFYKLLKEELKPLTQVEGEKQGVLIGDLQNLSFLPIRFSFVLGVQPEAEEKTWKKTFSLLKQEPAYQPESEKHFYIRLLTRLIMHVEDKLTISYISTKEVSSKRAIYDLQRPTCLNEIVNFLCQSQYEPYCWQWHTSILEHLIHIHPAHKSDPPYFRDNAKGTYLSYNHEAYQQARLINEWLLNTEENPRIWSVNSFELEQPVKLNWKALKQFFDWPLAHFFESTLAIHLPSINFKHIQNISLENFEPHSNLWTSEFLASYENEGLLTCKSLDNWHKHLNKLLTFKSRQDQLEKKLYTTQTIKLWHDRLSQLHALISPHLPLKRENWLLADSLEENAIGEWTGQYCQLGGPSLYKTYRSGNDLFFLSAFERNLFPSDKAIMVLQACLYKVHPYFKEKALGFDKLYILNNSLNGWETLSWSSVQEDWFMFWQVWLLLAKKYPLPLCQNMLKALIATQEFNSLHDCFTFIEKQLRKITNPMSAWQGANFYLEKSQRYYQILDFHPKQLPQDCENFFSQLKKFWASVTLEA